jgi:hypothetical protein
MGFYSLSGAWLSGLCTLINRRGADSLKTFLQNFIQKILIYSDRNLVPKGGFEPPRGSPTTPSRWRVYQFHHFGNLLIQNPSHLPLTKGGVSKSPFGKGEKGGLLLRVRQGCLGLNRNLLRFCRSCLSRPFFHHCGSSF